VNIALLFFLLITHGCGVPVSWAARHTTVCLDGHFKVINHIDALTSRWLFFRVSYMIMPFASVVGGSVFSNSSSVLMEVLLYSFHIQSHASHVDRLEHGKCN